MWNDTPKLLGALPDRVKEAVGEVRSPKGGVDGSSGLCWTASVNSLLIWRHIRGRSALVTSLGIPQGCSTEGTIFVEFVCQSSGVVSVVAVVTDGSCLVVWPDSTKPFDRSVQQLEGKGPTALAAAPLSSATGTAGGVLAVVGFKDGSLQRVEVPPGGATARSKLLQAPESAKGQQGVLGRLSSTVRAAYAETFYAASGLQAAPSGAEVVALRLPGWRLPGTPDMQRELLVLTADSLELWKLLPQDPRTEAAERCAASHRLDSLMHRSSAGLRPGRPLGLAALQGPGSVALLVGGTDTPSGGGMQCALMRLRLGPGASPSLEDAWVVPGPAAQPTAGAPGKGYQLLPGSASALPALVVEPAGAMWVVGEGAGRAAEATPLAGDGSVLGCAVSADKASWLLLDPKQGVLLVRIVASCQEDSNRAASALSRPAHMGQSMKNQIYSELDNALSQVSGGQQPKALGYTLDKLGAFTGSGASNVVAQYSTDLIDRLPKHWSAESPADAAESAASVSTALQLEHKIARHSDLLDVLEADGCLDCMEGTALRIVLQNAEKCAALHAIRELDNRLPHRLKRGQKDELRSFAESCGWAEPGKAGGRSSEAIADAARRAGVTADHVKSFLLYHGEQPLHEAIAEAGGSLKGTSELFSQREPSEVFYARATAAVPLLFEAMADILQAGLRVTHQKACLAAVRQLLETAEVALLRAASAREDLQRRFPRACAVARGAIPASVPWSSGDAIRRGLHALLECCLERRPPIRPQRNADYAAEIRTLLFSTADKLLSAFAEAEAALMPAYGSSEEASSEPVAGEYAAAKQQALQALLEEAKWEAEHKSVGYMELASMREVERLARHHCSYPQLVDICEMAGDVAKLHWLMESCGPPGEFCSYVMQRLVGEGREAELLQLPRHFDDVMLEFLGELPALRWKHEIRMRLYEGAASTLGQLAAEPAPSLAEKRRLLSLEHLCHLATASTGLAGDLSDDQVQAANGTFAELALLDVQRAVGMEDTDRPLEKAALVSAAVSAGEEDARKYPLALVVFALSGEDFMLAHEDQMKFVWLKIASATDWSEVMAARSTATDDEWAAVLDSTPLVQALRDAYYQYGLEAQIPADNLKEWLSSEPRLDDGDRQAALIALDYAISGVGAGENFGTGEDAMEH
uniref:Nuclear pore complex protein Nup133 n=1 Tax=Tetraselmis sp. GSL018 TaxID=582737 RepID=A0A061SF20_9CHLO